MKVEYVPTVTKEYSPAIYLNTKIMQEFRPNHDESKYKTYLEELGIVYSTVRK